MGVVIYAHYTYNHIYIYMYTHVYTYTHIYIYNIILYHITYMWKVCVYVTLCYHIPCMYIMYWMYVMSYIYIYSKHTQYNIHTNISIHIYIYTPIYLQYLSTVSIYSMSIHISIWIYWTWVFLRDHLDQEDHLPECALRGGWSGTLTARAFFTGRVQGEMSSKWNFN